MRYVHTRALDVSRAQAFQAGLHYMRIPHYTAADLSSLHLANSGLA